MQKIEIDNFGPIKYAEIELTQIVLLIGEQASGKSTIGKLIYFFKSLKEDFFGCVYEHSNNDDFRIHLIKRIKSKFHLFFGSINHLPEFSIKFYYSVSTEKYIILRKQGLDSTSLQVTFAKNFYRTIGNELSDIVKAFRQQNNAKTLYEIKAKETEKAKYLTRLVSIISRIFDDKQTSLYIPAGRNITVSYPNQFRFLFFGELSVQFEKIISSANQELYSSEHSVDTHLMKEFLKEIEGITDKFKNKSFIDLINNQRNINDKFDDKSINYIYSLIKIILKGEYVSDSYGEKIYFDFQNNRYIHLHNASSGQQESIRILQDLFLTVLDRKNVFRVIEEPEAHLYPIAQKNIIEIIATVSKTTQSQFIITTHSPYILNVFNNLLFANRVVESNKDMKNRVDEIIPLFSHLSSKEFRAYSLKNKDFIEANKDSKSCISIIDDDTGLISQNYLDEVSEDLSDDFDNLYNLHKLSVK